MAAVGVHHQAALPLYDLFLDLPHPAAAKSSPPPVVKGAPSTSAEMKEELNSNLSRIGRFAFPEFDDATSQGIPRETTLNRFSQYAMQPKAFQHYTFSLQLQSGVRMHGHVRKYLPSHSLAPTRYDVGRRGERALVILTRANGGDLVYSAILKTLDAILSQQAALQAKMQPHEHSLEWFLQRLFDQHQKLCQAFAGLPQHQRKPLLMTVSAIEAGIKPVPRLDQVDLSKFLIPSSLLTPTSSVVESVTSSAILPLLRVLGVQNSLRLLSGLLSESRILMVSSSPTRLAQCARSALSLLAQGLLNWQHIFIPVLPPHLFQYLAAPVPYLIGMLTSLMPRLDQARADGLGEMIIINLDTVQMETRGINPAEVSRKIPDLFRSAQVEPGMPVASMTATEMLAQDLVDLLKVDKKSLHGESTLTNVSETAAKATKAVKSGFLKLKQKGKKLLAKTTSNVSGGSDDEDLDGSGGGETPSGGEKEENTLLPDYIYTQGAQNEVAEEEARIAITSFFLSMFGNMRWYLSAEQGQLPRLDRQRFLQQKRAMGEGENTPIWPLLQNFCQTQMLEEFAKARVEEVRTRLPVTSASPLFTQCANYHRMHNIDFSVASVRRVARQVAVGNPSRLILQTQARRQAMLLTSNRTYEGDYNRAVSQLVEDCRECSSVLFDVMSVIWVRMRDSKGLHWKHGFQALQIMRNLLYHGPLAAISEATDGLDKIRVMKFYNDNMRSQICTQIRQVATQVYNLLMDRAKLFAIRRLCINKRRAARNPDQTRLSRDTRMRIVTPFVAMHKAFNPRVPKVAPMPGGVIDPTPQFAAEQDLLGFASAPVAPAPAQTPVNTIANEMAGLFAANVSISNATPAATPSSTTVPAPVDPFASSNPVAVPTPQYTNQAPTPQDPFATSMTPAQQPTSAPAPHAPPVQAAPAQVPPAQPQPAQVPAQPQYQTSLHYPPQQQPPQQQFAAPTNPPAAQPYVATQVPAAARPPAHQTQPYPVQGHGLYPQPPSGGQPVGQPAPAYGAQGYPPHQYQQQLPYQPHQGAMQAPPHYQQQQQAYPPAQGQPRPNVAQFDPFK